MIVVLLVAACGGAADDVASDASEPVLSEAGVADDATPEVSEAVSAPAATASDAPDGVVNVVLSEWIVQPDPASAAAGDVTFRADVQGGEAHELVVVRADDPADLPTDADGAVDEDQIAPDDFVGEIEELEPKSQEEATFTLDAGTYVLFCNITETEDDGEIESHFDNGMSTTFEVAG